MKKLLIIGGVFVILTMGCSRQVNQYSSVLVEESEAKTSIEVQPDMSMKNVENRESLGMEIIPISREEAGLRTIAVTDISHTQIHPYIIDMVEMQYEMATQEAQNTLKFPDEYYQQGFEVHPQLKYEGVVITERWQDGIIGDIGIGSTIQQVEALLGEPGQCTQPYDDSPEWFLYYKTADYYIAFNGREGSQQVERIMFRKTPPPLEQTDIMREVIEYALETNMFETWGMHDFFDSGVHWQGQQYRSSVHGLSANDNYGDPVIIACNHFTGNLYRVTPEDSSPFRIKYIDQDSHIMNMREIFDTLRGYHNVEIYKDNISPDGRYAYKAEWVNSVERYYIIYDLLGFRHPMCVYAQCFENQDGWLDNNKLWYTEDYFGDMRVIEITDDGYKVYSSDPEMDKPEGYRRRP